MDQVTRQMLGKIKREIETLQDEISKLQQMETAIIERFDNHSDDTGTADEKAAKKSGQTRRIAPLNGTPRKITIHEWLKKHGPATREEIIQGTRLPPGTVGAYLSVEKDLFQRSAEGWHAR